MTSKQSISRKEFDELVARMTALEEKIEAMGNAETKPEEETKAKTQDKGEQIFGDPGVFLNNVVETAMGAFNEAAGAMSKAAEKAKKTNSDDLPSSIIQMLRQAVDVQSQAIDHFEDNLRNKKKKEPEEESEPENA